VRRIIACNRIPVLDMEEFRALPEGLRLVISSMPIALARVDRAEALVEAAGVLE